MEPINKTKTKNLETQTPKYFLGIRLNFVISAIVVVFSLSLLFIFISSRKESFGKDEKNETALTIGNQTIGDLVQSDLDKDGIPDWEESLWGTDKNNRATFGMPDLEYIEGKKNELDIEQAQNDKTLTETEKFAREFFASYSALQTSGASDEMVNNLSNKLGESIGDPNLPDIYTTKDIKTTNDTTEISKIKYYSSVSNLYEEYETSYSLGDELEMVSNELVSHSSGNSSESLKELYRIGEAYKSFAEEIMILSVPKNLSNYHLNIANSAHNTGVSVLNMMKVTNDPVIGISGVSQYQKYSKDFEKAVSDLENSLFGTTSEDNNDTMYYGDINQ